MRIRERVAERVVERIREWLRGAEDDEFLGNAAMQALLGFWLSYLSHPGSVSCRRLMTRRGQCLLPMAAWSLVSIMASARDWHCLQRETRMWAAAWQVRRTPSSAWLSGQMAYRASGSRLSGPSMTTGRMVLGSMSLSSERAVSQMSHLVVWSW